jgi:signal recognition particle subunit SEC65
VLLINLPREEILRIPSNIEISTCSIGSEPTLHDYHAIIMDVSEVGKIKVARKDETQYKRKLGKEIVALRTKVEEELRTGGIMICFSGDETRFDGYHNEHYSNYDWCPVDLGVTSFPGDTVHPKFEELKYYAPLFKALHDKSIYWTCYFSKARLPKNSRVLATSRAGYPISVEIPIGLGKLVMLPKFKNRSQAATTIVNEVLPHMVGEEEPTYLPEWLSEFVPTIEAETKGLLKEIDSAKKLLYSKDRALKKAVAHALEKMGFAVKIIPDGTLPDLQISTDEAKAVVEVKGHDKEQADRKDVLQLLGYLSETDPRMKGVFICNHKLLLSPVLRGEEAYTAGAVQLARANEICLLSTFDLWKRVLSILEGETTPESLARTRKIVMTGTGIVTLT